MRLVRVIILIFVSALFVQNGQICQAKRSTSKKDVIQFAIASSGYSKAFEEIIRNYEKLHPNIKVELHTQGPLGFQTWIRSRIAAGGEMTPDIYNANFTVGYERQGKWVVLDKYYNSINPYTGKLWHQGLDMSLTTRIQYAGNYYHVILDNVEISIFYNKDIFDKVGLSEPKTWNELLQICEKLKQAGFVPIAMAGDTDSFWSSGFGWLVRIMGDAYLRNYVPILQSRPGDWDYDPKKNADYKYDPNDPYSDMMVVLNVERTLNAILNGDLDFRSPRLKQIYVRLKELAQYFQDGFLGSGFGSASRLFYKQKAAMCAMGSERVTAMVQDFKKMDPSERFEFSNFWFPPITDDPLVCGAFRGVGGGGTTFAVMKKGDAEHERNVIDFLMYMTTPESGQILVERTLAENEALVGPILIKGVKMPEELTGKFKPFMGHGFEKLNFRGLEDEQESVAEWTVIAQEFFGNRLTLDEFCDKYHEIMVNTVARLQGAYGYDLDPTTKPEEPVVVYKKNRFNPFENGSLMLLIVIGLFGSYAFYHISKSTGPAKTWAKIAYLFLFPTFLFLGAFNYFPALSGLYHAFTKWDGGRQAIFCGLDNFRKLATDTMFYRGMWNMIILVAAALVKATLIPFIAAEIIFALTNKKMQYFFRTAFLLPMVVPGMVIILIWKFIYDPNLGMLNQALTTVGLEGLASSWLGNPSLALGSIIFMGFPWIGAFGLLIYMAGLMNIPQSVYEAYRLESKGVLKRIITIDAPLVKGQTRMLAILIFIMTIQDFQTILIMTGGGPGMATYVPALRMYYQAFTYSHFGYGAAIGLILFLGILLVTIINMKIIKPEEEL